MKLFRVRVWLALVLTGGLVLPISAYWLGGRMVGAYAGQRGLATYYGSIYQDATAGSPLALTLLTGPVVVLLIWKLRSWLLSRCLAPAPGAGTDD